MNKLVTLICGGMLLGARLASADSLVSGNKGPPVPLATTSRTLTITGIVAEDSADSDPANGGACNFDGWVDHCAVTSGGCDCLKITVTKASGSLDKGTQSISDFFVSVDTNVLIANEPVPSALVGPDPNCFPIRGTLTDAAVNTKGQTDTKTLRLDGVTSRNVNKITKSNPQGNHLSDTFVGGWGIAAKPNPNPDASGWGTFSGTVTNATNAVSLKITGLVTE